MKNKVTRSYTIDKKTYEEFRIYASYALDNNDKTPVYRDENENDFNILHEKIGE